MPPESVDEEAVADALEAVDRPRSDVASDDVEPIGDGVNDVFAVRTGASAPARVVCKFATFSEAASLGAGAVAFRLLAARSDLPVPEVYALHTDPPDLPPFVVLEHLPGEPLPSRPTPDRAGAARALGHVIADLDSIPPDATAGYGSIRPDESIGTAEIDEHTRVVGEFDDAAQWLVSYGEWLYDRCIDHEALAGRPDRATAYLREYRDRLPADESPSIVVTDLMPSNLLAPGGAVPDEATLSDVTGVVDLERAKFGPQAFTAVNAEVLMCRWVENRAPLVEALYEPLPFGPEMPNRDLYRLLALGRYAASLDLWYRDDPETRDRRAREIGGQITEILD